LASTLHCGIRGGEQPETDLSTIASDTPLFFRQDRPTLPRRIAHFMPSLRTHARWTEALRSTVALWLFVLFVFLPVIIQRHRGEPWTGVAIDGATVIYSIGLAMLMFVVSRATIGMPPLVRLPLRALAVMVAAATNLAADLMFQGWIGDHLIEAWRTLPADFSRAYSSMFNYTLTFGVNMILFHVNYARRANIASERQLAEANKAAHQAQLAALRYQLNPHFLFNSLNSISALIVTKRNKDAEAMTDKLSSFLRTSLNADPAALIPLDEELALTEEYLDIESVRFGDRLKVAVDCKPDACAALVPSFLVQPLVENAVKHGVARSRAPVEIEIDAELREGALRIVVANCVAEESDDELPGTTGAGVGLDNVRNRLRAVFGKRASLTAGRVGARFVATISIPEVKRAN
jgi:hypothetical protein